MNGSVKKEQTRVLSCTHTLPNAACSVVGVAFGVEDANHADSTFRRAEMLTPVINL